MFELKEFIAAGAHLTKYGVITYYLRKHLESNNLYSATCFSSMHLSRITLAFLYAQQTVLSLLTKEDSKRTALLSTLTRWHISFLLQLSQKVGSEIVFLHALQANNYCEKLIIHHCHQKYYFSLIDYTDFLCVEDNSYVDKDTSISFGQVHMR